MNKHIHEFIIITFAFLSICYPKEFAIFSISPLGKIVATLLIVAYSFVDEIYGLIVCAMIILYYQTDYVEHLQYESFYSWKQLMGFVGVEQFSLEGLENVSEKIDSMYEGFQKNMSSLIGFDYMGGNETDEINKNSKTSKSELHAIFSGIREASVEFVNGTFL
jgi:hypothetical protein